MDSAAPLLSVGEARAALDALGQTPTWVESQGGPCPVTVERFLRGRSIDAECHARLSVVLLDARRGHGARP